MQSIWLVALAFGAVAPTLAHEITFASGPAQVALVELFTSEGCSSCPPAERWLAVQRSSPDLWKTFVPISWHVDYWNRLGWPDRFSSREFTDRQYAYAAAWGNNSVYTPCFVRDGREWRPSAAAIGSRKHAGVLTARYDGAVLRVTFTPAASEAAPGSPLTVHGVLLGSGIVSKVTAGENDGSTLEHEFVALKLVHGRLNEALPLPRQNTTGVRRYALAVWITGNGGAEPIQAVGGWLD